MALESRCTGESIGLADAAHLAQTACAVPRFPAVQLDRAVGSLKSRRTAHRAVSPP